MQPRIEPIIYLLAGLLVFFTLCLFAAEHWFATDGQIFQVISGLLTGISGAMLMRVKPQTNTKTEAPTEYPVGADVSPESKS